MKRILALVAVLTMLAGPAFAQKEEPRAPDPIVEFSAEDAAMNAAIEDARRTLPQFWAEFDATSGEQQGAFAVKVGMPVDGGGHEHIWVDSIHREGGVLVGALANEPNWMPGMHMGSRVVIDPELISDWSIHSSEGLFGSYTTRVMLPYLDPAEAAQMSQILTRSPTPAHWSS